jgi:hypothetical protein
VSESSTVVFIFIAERTKIQPLMCDSTRSTRIPSSRNETSWLLGWYVIVKPLGHMTEASENKKSRHFQMHTCYLASTFHNNGHVTEPKVPPKIESHQNRFLRKSVGRGIIGKTRLTLVVSGSRNETSDRSRSAELLLLQDGC